MKLVRFLLIASIIGLSIFLFTNKLPFYWGIAATISALTILWLISLVVKDASIIDIFWGLGFVILAWTYRVILQNNSGRSLIICILVTIWGVRLALYLANRNLGKGEDYRYQAWRKEYGGNFWWVSYFRVFLLQGLLLWLIGATLLVAQTANEWTSLDYVGVFFWTIGLIFESVGDYQLAQFKKNPDNKGKVLDSGLWRYTRHPNYFGDAVLWWGLFCFAASAGAWWTIFSTVLMTFSLMKVSGVALLEKTLVETKPQYKDYVKRTSAFFPTMPK
jgi:steroid 5-alpha reductase family enzyme